MMMKHHYCSNRRHVVLSVLLLECIGLQTLTFGYSLLNFAPLKTPSFLSQQQSLTIQQQRQPTTRRQHQPFLDARVAVTFLRAAADNNNNGLNGDAASSSSDSITNNNNNNSNPSNAEDTMMVNPAETNSSSTAAVAAADNGTLLGGLSQSPQLSFEKYMTMQDKRVVVTIRYSGEAGLKPYFLTVAKKLKASHPDVMIERRILADAQMAGDEEPTFEVLVDGRLVLGRGKKQKAVDMPKARSVFVSMQELDLAISRARRRRRPATAYAGGSPRPNSNDSGNAD